MPRLLREYKYTVFNDILKDSTKMKKKSLHRKIEGMAKIRGFSRHLHALR